MSSLSSVFDPVASSSGDLSFSVASSFEATGLSQSTWDDFVRAAGGDFYSSYDWCRLWWSRYGVKRKLAIFVFRCNETIVAILPFFIEPIGMRPFAARVAKVVGSDSALALSTPVIRADVANQVLPQVMKSLFSKFKCDAVSIGPVSATWASLSALRESAQADGCSLVRDVESGSHTIFNVPHSIEDYFSSLSKKKRAHLRRQVRELEKDHKVCHSVIRDVAEIEREFATFQLLHAQQWNEQGKLGHFEDWPGAVQFNCDLVQRLGADRKAVLLKMTADQETISYDYGFIFGDTFHWRLSARLTGQKWDEYGLGTIGILEKFKMAVAERLKNIEAGIGHYDYKLQWGAEEFEVRHLLVGSTAPLARARIKLMIWSADLLHLLYYRSWFLRIAPKLPLKRRPLWRWWIRSRI